MSFHRLKRQRRFIWAAAVLFGAVGGPGLAYYVVTGTDRGRQWLVTEAITRANQAFKGRGSLRVGVLREISPGRIVAERVSLVDTAGVPVVTAESLDGTLNVRGLFRKAIHIRRLTLRGVSLDLRQAGQGPWNIAYIISGDTVQGMTSGPGFGDDVRIDSLLMTRARVSMIAPWAPHPIFRGAARDSVIAVRDSLHDIIPGPNNTFLQRRLVTLDRVLAHDAIVVDVQKRPASIQLDSVRGVVSDPPVRVTHAGGQLRWTSDSLQLNLPDVQLPASRGSATGTVAWNQPGPVRYDIVVKANAGLSDLGWIWEALPPEGRGTATVRMRTLLDPDDVEFSLSSLDVSSGASRITGNVDVVVRPANMLLQRVDLAFMPLHSDLLRRLSYDAVPKEIRGTFTGRMTARNGGPLTAFRLDLLDARFLDAGVPGGALSTVSLRGTVALGDRPRVWDMTVNEARVDLRSVRALSPLLVPSLIPSMPAIDGMLTARVLIRDADLNGADLSAVTLTWTDALGHVSTVRGDVRARYGGAAAANPQLVAALQLSPLSMQALARIDTTLPLRSDIRGRVTVHGALDAMRWTATLTAGALREAPLSAALDSDLAFEGTVAIRDSMWQVTASGALDHFDVRAWFGRADVPSTAIAGLVRLTVQGPRLSRDVSGNPSALLGLVQGNIGLALAQTQADDRPAFDLVGSASLGADRLFIDSAMAQIGGVQLEVHGALARDSMHFDTLQLSARADSLDTVRAQLGRLASMVQSADSNAAASLRSLAADTLTGDLSLSGFLYGSVFDAGATAALGARGMQIGGIRVGRVFGSAHAEHVFTRPTFEGTATADNVDGIGAIRLQTVGFRVTNANLASGQLSLDVSSQTEAQLIMRGAYQRTASSLSVAVDSLRLTYADVVWNSAQPIVVQQDSLGFRLFPVVLRSNADGVLRASADLPRSKPISGTMQVEQLPIGEIAALLAGTPALDGTLSGSAALAGSRLAPLISWQIRGDSLGLQGLRLPPVNSTGRYAEKQLVADAVLQDSIGGTLRADVRLPFDLSIADVEMRLLSEQVDARIIADSLRLEGLPLSIDGVRNLRGRISGQLVLGGNMDRPIARGTLIADNVGASITNLGITPTDGRIVLRAAEDSLILESMRIRSGGSRDTIGATGALHFHPGEPSTVSLRVLANNAALSRHRDGTDVNLSGNVLVVGPVKQPMLSGAIVIPRANLVIDPLGARNAVDLSTEAARELLGADEVPVAATAAQSLAALGSLLTLQNARVDLGNDVWVQTPESRVKIAGGLSVALSGERLALEGEVTANRGQYRLDLGVVNRSFNVDSGRVRFFGNNAISPTLDISATNVVREAGGSAIPVRVHIGGTYDVPVLTLSSPDPLYSSAPESEIISLLLFGAPTFALDDPSQSTVRAVTGVLLPAVGGAVEGALQRLLPGVNTIQVITAGGQSQQSLSAFSLLDNLSISAGKQLGPRTFLRLNTGVCRGGTSAVRGASLWAGVAAEYRFARYFSGQIGVDPGASPCTQLGTNGFPRMQFGFDLFRDWIF